MFYEAYKNLGISKEVYEFGEKIIDGLKDRFDKIDKIAEYNQCKVLSAMKKNRVDAACFAASTGYGYNDLGRDKIERVYADTFHTEAALVRPQIVCGTHALTVALSANLLPGDELLSPVGKPYDTLEEVIGIRESKCSLKEYGVTYKQVDLLPDGTFDYGLPGVFLPLLCYPIKNRWLRLIPFAAGITWSVLSSPFPSSPIPYFAFIAVIFVALYNGERGKLNLKYFFYIFYPAHILVIEGIYLLLNI